MLVVVDLLHKVVDFASLRSGDISSRLLTLVHKLFKEGINFTIKGLPVESTLHSRQMVILKLVLQLLIFIFNQTK